MKMTFYWYGSGFDPTPLKYTHQIPGVTGAVGILVDVPAGEFWPLEKIRAFQEGVNDAGLELEVTEGVSVHENIKLGLSARDYYIKNYKQTLRDLKEIGVKVVCYNFMPVLNWTRFDLAKVLPDGSNVLSYDQSIIDKVIDPQEAADETQKDSGELEMPGWEPERTASLKQLFEQYKNASYEDLFANLKYLLGQIIPVCKECDTKMAIHPDDSPRDILGLSHIVASAKNLEKILGLVDSKYNGLTLCSDSFSSDPNNDVSTAIHRLGNWIHLACMRNIKIHERDESDESSHLSPDGSLDLFEIMKAYYDVDFEGYACPDHGRMIWNEESRIGYGLYDRALSITCLNGLWEVTNKVGTK